MKQGRLLLASGLAAFLLLSLAQSALRIEPGRPDESPTVSNPAALLALQARYKSLTRQLAQLAPNRPYIVVDTARNHLFIKRRDRIMLDALASTGSGTILDKPGETAGQWIFDTPRGEFSVQSKLVNPVWVKPDWAFVEEGLAVPASQADRVEPGVLGEYALGFGKGYFIHGTLYPRLLGKNVTHGCIRLNDDDLKSVYQLARVGTPIMIF
ncbi:MAG TPA: L,D-transpeptidase [Nitrospira sp.]|nr:L,D-transpeptidase [Nitrospira sp.]